MKRKEDLGNYQLAHSHIPRILTRTCCASTSCARPSRRVTSQTHHTGREKALELDVLGGWEAGPILTSVCSFK